MSLVIGLVFGFVLDMFFGTPKVLKSIYNFIFKSVKDLYKKISKRNAILVTIFVPLIICVLFYYLVFFIKNKNISALIVFESIICYLCISNKEIKKNSERLFRALKKGYNKNASRIINNIQREENLTEPSEIVERVIILTDDEALDKVIAPIFYILFFGVGAGVFYKVISIIADSTNFGLARFLKNLFELIPARLGILFITLSIKLQKFNIKKALEVLKRDRYNIKDANRGLFLCLSAGALDMSISLNGAFFGNGNPNLNHKYIRYNYEIINIGILLNFVILVLIKLLCVIFIV